MSRRHPRPGPTPKPGSDRARAVAVADEPAEGAGLDPDAEFALWLGERFRRFALGATAALVVARAYYASEPDYTLDAGTGLNWVAAVLVVAALALAGALIGGTLRLRLGWTDLAVVALVGLVALSAGHAVDFRVAVNLACEWSAVGIVYLLLRNLPRTRAESAAVAGALAATAVAVAVYGLYQVNVELPSLQQKYRANPLIVLRIMGIEPGTPSQSLFENRLLGSNEPYSTFGLANSLAGFLLGPLVVMLGVGWDNLTRPGRGSRLGALALAALPGLLVLYCLVLTKSRSAWVGLAVGMTILAWRERRRVPARVLGVTALGLAVVAGAVVALGLATGRLDRQVVTESGKSLGYRRQYWEGAWRVINDNPRAFWSGYGPGNFAAPYVKHKDPTASEDVKDPHNLLLEVWAAAGVTAAAALVAAAGLGLGATLARREAEPADDPAPSPKDAAAPPSSAGWLVIGAGLGWLVAFLPLGGLNPFEGDQFVRWLILGGSWVFAVVAGGWLWRRRPLDGAVLGAAFAAVLVNLLAAGGIGIPTVALGLWSALALGLNLRDDRGAGRLRDAGGRLAAFGVAAVWAALAGTFVGQVAPFWKAERLMAAADDAADARPPDFDRAAERLEAAAQADKFTPRPWQRLAALELQVWRDRGAKPDDLRWRKVPYLLKMAVTPPRPPNAWARQFDRARLTALLIKQLGGGISPLETTRMRADVVQASRTAANLYPANATLHAWLAEASAAIGMIPDAVKEGREALRLDALNPHPDRKLHPSVRQWLGANLPVWREAAAGSTPANVPGTTPPSDTN